MLCTAAIFLAGCQKENSNEWLKQQSNHKVDICHKGHLINVSINAVNAHDGHGNAIDLDGDGFFSEENTCGFLLDCDDTDGYVLGEGNWAGELEQIDCCFYDATITFGCGFTEAIIDYGFCTGMLELVSQDGDVYVFAEEVTEGCVPDCSVTIEIMEDGTMSFLEDCGDFGSAVGVLDPQ